MKSLGTARTPITAAYESGKDRNILPKDIKSTREVRGQARRVLIPEKIAKQNPPRQALGPNPILGVDRSGAPIPSRDYLGNVKVSAWNPLKGAWDLSNPSRLSEMRALNIAAEGYRNRERDWASYNRNVKDVEKNTKDRSTATQKKKLKAIASKRNGARKAITRAKGSRTGLSRAGGLRGGSR
jgi:hypothetical protein